MDTYLSQQSDPESLPDKGAQDRLTDATSSTEPAVYMKSLPVEAQPKTISAKPRPPVVASVGRLVSTASSELEQIEALTLERLLQHRQVVEEEDQKGEYRTWCCGRGGCGKTIAGRWFVPLFEEEERVNNFINTMALALLLLHIPLSHAMLGYFTCIYTPDRLYLVS